MAESGVIVELVDLASVDRIWPLISHRIIKCLDKTPSYLGAGEVWQMTRSGQLFLIIAHDGTKIVGASIWRFEQAYGKTVFNCFILVGEKLATWVADLVEFARSIAKDGGAALITATGRVGLVAVLKKHIPNLKITRQSYLLEV